MQIADAHILYCTMEIMNQSDGRAPIFFRDFRVKFAVQRRGWCVRMYKMQSHRHSVAICCVNWFGFVTAATAASWVMPFWSMQFGKFCNTQQWARIDSFTLWMLCDAMWVWLLAESWKNIPLYQHIQAGEYCVARIYLCFLFLADAASSQMVANDLSACSLIRT